LIPAYDKHYYVAFAFAGLEIALLRRKIDNFALSRMSWRVIAAKSLKIKPRQS